MLGNLKTQADKLEQQAATLRSELSKRADQLSTAQEEVARLEAKLDTVQQIIDNVQQASPAAPDVASGHADELKVYNLLLCYSMFYIIELMFL